MKTVPTALTSSRFDASTTLQANGIRPFLVCQMPKFGAWPVVARLSESFGFDYSTRIFDSESRSTESRRPELKGWQFTRWCNELASLGADTKAANL